jgi:2-iminobutanoate/2-iminopropanoate deaminase
MERLQIVSSDRAPKAIGPYAQGMRAGGFLFLSGQVPLDPATGELVRGTLEDEVARVLDNLKAILEAAGAGLDRVVRTTVYLTDLGDFAAMNGVYARFFGESRPARSTVQVAALPRGARIEIDAIALID